MKTIDEVIRAVHYCGLLSNFDDDYEYDGGCPYADCSACEEKRMLGKDVIKYLNKYKRISAKLEKIALGNITETLEKLDNSALTWDELKIMEGKPVWVEINGYNGYWTIVHWNSNIVFAEYYDWNASPEDPMKVPIISLDDTNFCKSWQAYRKERDEVAE